MKNPATGASRKIRILGLVGFSFCLAMLGLVGTPQAKDPVEIGMAVALTGPYAANDAHFVDGVKVATKRINAAGGVNGREFRLHILDNASNATTGVTVTNQLLNQFNISVMLNGNSSAQAVAITPIVTRAKVPMITSAQLPPERTWAFLAIVSSDKVVDQQLHFAKEYLHATKIAFIHSQTPYGQLGASLVKAGAAKLGLEVILTEGVEVTALDLTATMAKVKDAQPDAVLDFLTGVHIVAAKGAATAGMQVPLVMASDDTSTLKQSAAAYGNAFAIVSAAQAYPAIADPDQKAATDAFVKAYREDGLNMITVANASSGWDAVNILAEAVKISDATGGDALRQALEKVTYQGSYSSYKYSAADHTGQTEVRNPMQIARFKGDEIEVVFSGK